MAKTPKILFGNYLLVNNGINDIPFYSIPPLRNKSKYYIFIGNTPGGYFFMKSTKQIGRAHV